MPRIPIEDFCEDIIAKAQRGLQIADQKLCELAEITQEELDAVKAGTGRIPVIRRVARHLGLQPDALEASARKAWYPECPVFKRGFMMFNTAIGDMRVNNYVVWDPQSRAAALFDTGGDCGPTLDFIAAEGLHPRYIFLTHTHEDHVADLPRLHRETGAEVWLASLENFDFPTARRFEDGTYFHVGTLSIKTLLTAGHTPGQTSFFINGLSWPLAIVGDSLFAGSMGGSQTHYKEQLKNNVGKLTRLPRSTVIAPGHGPLTTLSQELQHNPFIARGSR